MPSNGGGLFSSLTSLFSATGLGEGSSSSSAYLDRKRSAYRGNGLPTSYNRSTSNTSGVDDDDAAWRMPYNPYISSANPSSDGAYPPRSAVDTPISTGRQPFASSVSNVNESTSTLVPGAAQSRHSLSLATNVSIPSTAYPPLKHTWRRIRTWCNRNYAEMGDTLNWPATEAQLDDLELTIGFALPPAVRDSYLCYDGQELESNQSCNDGLFFGLPLLSVERVAEEWRFWRNVDEDPSTGANPEVKGWMCSCPAGWVRPEYSCRGWIPLITDHVGNYIGVDLSPNSNGGGSPGQVILFGRDFDTKIVLWRGEGEGGWGRFLQYITEELESGEMWTLEEEVSNDSNDEEDGIGYDSYFSGGGSGAGRGGGDRGGDGAAGFKLKGEYKGWPVFEAWADRSMRAWAEIGMPAGQPAWRSEKPTPSVVLEEVHAGDHHVDENGESLDAEGSGPYGSRQAGQTTSEGVSSSNVSSSSTVHQADVRSSQEGSHPLDNTSAPATPTLDENNARYQSSTLSPPPMHSHRGGKQKQRQEGIVDTQNAEQRAARRAPPVPAAPLDLPTIDDVRIAHAAAIASQSRGGNFHYDLERAARPPPGMGGMGMGMGVGSTNSGGYRSSRSPYSPDVRMTFNRDVDGVELDRRTSNDGGGGGFYSVKRDSEQGLVGLSDSRRGSATMDNGSPRASINGLRSPNHLSAGRTLYAASNSSEAVDTLIDASSSPDVSIQIEGTKAAANGILPNLVSSNAAAASAAANAPGTSSPLAKHSPVFASLQTAVNGGDAAQPMTA